MKSPFSKKGEREREEGEGGSQFLTAEYNFPSDLFCWPLLVILDTIIIFNMLNEVSLEVNTQNTKYFWPFHYSSIAIHSLARISLKRTIRTKTCDLIMQR